MRKTAIWLMAAALGLALGGPAFAAASPAAGSSPSEPANSTAPRTPRTRQFWGDVVYVDQPAKTLSVKRTTTKSVTVMTFTAESTAAGALADLKPGDHVKVSYGEDGYLVATIVAKTEPTAEP
jgi:hypothetical protein